MVEKKKNTVDLLLADAFKELACQMPIEKITIKQITDKAGVIRPTFYNHFEDKYKLLEWVLITDILDPVQPLVENGMVNEAILLIFHNILRNRDFYMSASRLKGQNSFEGMVRQGIQVVLCRLMKEKMKGKIPTNPWLTPEHLSEYYAQTVTYVLISWIESGMELSPDQLMEVYEFLITKSPAEALEDISGWSVDYSLKDVILEKS